MTLQSLKAQIRSGAIDTVIVAMPDPFGRLVGKRFRGDVFLNSVLKHGTHGCNYLLTVNMEMDPLDGFKVASWEAGFGDFAFRPDERSRCPASGRRPTCTRAIARRGTTRTPADCLPVTRGERLRADR